MSRVIRFQFRKGQELRFLSHLDLIRTLERAVRRGRLPIAFSEGFSPRPKMSFGSALAVGIMSEAEYADFEFTERIEPNEFMTTFNSVLPTGLEVIRAVLLPPKSLSLMTEINAAEYKLVAHDTDAAGLVSRIKSLQTADSFVVERKTKKGIRLVDLRPLLYEVEHPQEIGSETAIRCRCAVGSSGNLRPNELCIMLGMDPFTTKIVRTALLIKEDGSYQDPFDRIEGHNAT